jgi:hypothetical protein
VFVRSRLVLAAGLFSLLGSAVAGALTVSPAPSLSKLPTTATVVRAVTAAEGKTKVPTGSITPPLTSTGLYWTSVNPGLSNPSKPGCVINDAATTIPAVIGTSCAYGDPTSTRVVALVGDSNANAWIPALDTWGYVNNVKVVAVVHAACAPWERPWLPKDRPIWGEITERKCAVWRRSMMSKVTALSPSLVIPVGITATDKSLKMPTTAELTTALTAMVTYFTPSKVALLEPVPQFTLASSVLACVSGHRTSLDQCEVRRSAVTSNALNQVFRQVATSKKVAVIPTLNLFCGPTRCPLFVTLNAQNYLVYEDGYHISHQYAQIIGAALPLASHVK